MKSHPKVSKKLSYFVTSIFVKLFWRTEEGAQVFLTDNFYDIYWSAKSSDANRADGV